MSVEAPGLNEPAPPLQVPLVAPPKEISEVNYLLGTAGQEIRMRMGPGEYAGADSPRAAAGEPLLSGEIAGRSTARSL